MNKKIVGILVCTLLITTIQVNADYFRESNPVDSSPSADAGSPVTVAFRLLAVEQCFRSSRPTDPDDFMVSAQLLIKNLTRFNNWVNGSGAGFKYNSYIHFLSCRQSPTDIDPACLPYYVGTPQKGAVEDEIKGFLGKTNFLQGEDNSLTIRVFYFVGHGGKEWNDTSKRWEHYICLDYGPDYDRLYDYELDQLLRSDDLGTSNCTLVILDCCYSGGFISTLKRPGRVILTACNSTEHARGWSKSWGPSDPLWPGNWSWFTGVPYIFLGDGEYGPLGTIGGIRAAWDGTRDGWRSAGEICSELKPPHYDIKITPMVPSTPPPLSTTKYAAGQDNSSLPHNGSMHPRGSYGVVCGNIPLVQYNSSTPFPYNARPVSSFFSKIFHCYYICTFCPMFRFGPSHVGCTYANGPIYPGVRSSGLWSNSLGSPVQSSSAIFIGLTFVGTLGGGLYAIDLATGEVVWEFETASGVISSPAVFDGMVFFGTTDGILYALNMHTGFVRWSYEFEPGTQILSSPVIVDDMVFISTMGGGRAPIHVHAFNETTGELLWSSNTLGSTMGYSSPAVADGKVYVGGGDNKLYCLYANNGEIDWEYPTGGVIYSSPAVADGKVFFGCSDQKLYCLNTDGTLCWTYTTGGGIYSSPAVDSDKSLVIVGCADGNVYAVDEMTGAFEWDYYTGPIHMSSPAISKNGLFYIGSMNNKLYCLNETTGEEVWSYETEGSIESSPAITDDHVLIGSNDGNLYCFGPPFPIRNVAVTSVTVSTTGVSQGDPVEITYTVKNKGNVPETFNTIIAYNTTPVWAPPFYNDTTPIHNETVTLQPGANVTKTYIWDTTDVPPGKYTISGQVLEIPYETDTRDNIYMDDTVGITSYPVVFTIPLNQPSNQQFTLPLFFQFLERLFERFPNAFPILRQLLGL